MEEATVSGIITNKKVGSESYVATDQLGRKGFGTTPEEAQQQLEIAQAKDLDYAAKAAAPWFPDVEGPSRTRFDDPEPEREPEAHPAPKKKDTSGSPSSGGGVGLIGWVGGIVFVLWALERFFTWLDVSLPPVFDLPASIYVFWPSLVLGLTWVLHKCEVGLVKSFVSATLVVAGILFTIFIIVTR